MRIKKLSWQRAIFRKSRLLCLICGCLLSLTTIQSAYPVAAQEAGMVAMQLIYVAAAIFFMYLFISELNVLITRIKYCKIGWFCLFCIYLLCMLWGKSPEMYYRLVQLICVFALFSAISACDFSMSAIRMIAMGFTIGFDIIWIFLTVVWSSVGLLPLPANPNHIGLIALIASLIAWMGLIASKERYRQLIYFRLSLLFYVGLLIFSESRSCWLGMAASVFVYFCYWKITRHNWRYIAFFTCTLLVLSFIVYASSDLYGLGFRIQNSLNEFNLFVTSKRILSRYDVWTDVLDAIIERPLSGWGLGYERESFAITEYSSHSLYLEVFLQTGVVGLMCILLLLYQIGQTFAGSIRSCFDRFGFSVLIGIVVQQNFEGVLTQNKLALATTLWFLLGVCTSFHSAPYVELRGQGGKTIDVIYAG